MPSETLRQRHNYNREWREANREKVQAAKREYYEKNREEIKRRSREWYYANRERALARGRAKREAGYKKPRERLRDEIVSKLLISQGGVCYLCGDPIDLSTAVIEHDHRCCARQNTFCPACIRGASCQPCNKILAFARDNPTLLRRIADNLEPMLDQVSRRMSAAPEQLLLDEAA